MSKFLDYTGLAYFHSKLQGEFSSSGGRFYGFYTDASLLPTGDVVGYAYVGETQPFAIYNFNGTTWSDSGASIDGIKGEDGVGFESVSSSQDGTVVLTLTNGDTITIDLNHDHPSYLKYEYLESESEMPATPDATTLYLILDNSNA